jgi:probable F420-dependent oxidoreductase
VAETAQRFAMSVPGPGPLAAQEGYYRRLVELGYTDVWSGESGGFDGITPLVLAAMWAPELRLGTAILSSFTRGPALLAQTAATMAAVAPGRFVLGIGASSDVIVRRWNALEFARPYSRTRDVLRFLKMAITGERVTQAFETFTVDGFRMPAPQIPPLIMVAALRERMLRLGGSEGDGVILNWLSAEDVKMAVSFVEPSKEVVCRIFVCPSEDWESVRTGARRFVTEYLNVPVYADFQRWLGRGPALEPMQREWQARNRPAALAQVPDEVIDDLIVHGSPQQCREHIQRYVDNGVTTPMVALMPWAPDATNGAELLAPNRRPGSG